jgi:hypothetical protein
MTSSLFFGALGSKISSHFSLSTHCTGHLYVSSGSSHVLLSHDESLCLIDGENVLKDWHIILGHSLDLYLKSFFESMKIYALNNLYTVSHFPCQDDSH